jgi:hypothetical protein
VGHARRYLPAWQAILARIVAVNVAHVDETPINLHDRTGYVWVLASLEEVVYLYRPTREGDFLHELLKPFAGVLVSDFFSAYDALPFQQQRCLLHLIRDLNADILHNPYDGELKGLGSEFGRLLRPIIATVDTFGLKKRHLGKHKAEVGRFFHALASRQYGSETAAGYRERLLKNEGRLFTFLDHDGVPWNNNNAECAIKRFACYRRLADGQIREEGLKDYLLLLSICQTCRYKGVSFLKFLLSGEEGVDQYCQANRRVPPRVPPLDTYPLDTPRKHFRKEERTW